MTIKHLYPAVEPSLNLDFANSKKLDSRITFTRGSIGTYVGEDGLIKTAAANEARFDHDTDGNSLGLLIEESRTNLFDQSEDLTTWTSNLYTTTNNQAISPDGTLNAASLVPDAGVTSQSSGRTVTQSAGNHVCSVFAKPNGLTVLKIRFSGSSYQAFFNLTGNGSVASQSNGTASISKRPDGWYRCVFVINDSVGETAAWQLGHDDSSNVDGTNGFYIWGMQVEAGAFPTSYIPTSGSTVTRAADAASITGTNFSSWYNSSAGTVFTKFKSQYPDGEPTTIFEGQAGSTIRIFAFTNYNRVQFQYGSTGVYSNDGASGYPTESDFSSAALFYTDDGASSSFGGSYQGFPVKSGTGTGGVTISSLIFAPFTGASGALQASSAHLSRLTYYPVRLPDATLQALTL